MSVVAPARPGTDPGAGPAGLASQRDGERSWLTATRLSRTGLAVALLVGVGLRLWSPSKLWLDETLTVNIASVPLHDLQGALRRDGAPPVFYLLLHGWIRLFGSGTVAVRLLPGLIGACALPLMWLVGRRIGSVTTAWTATLLLATSPFAIKFSSEVRMYSLVVVLTLLGALALLRMLERPTIGRGAALGLATVTLALTHYWAFYLVAATAACLLLVARRRERRAPALAALAAMAAGGVLFLPWLPTFVFQIRHTGTPWAPPATFANVVNAVGAWAGGGTTAGRAIELLVLALFGLGLFGRAVDGRRVELDLHARPAARPLALVALGGLVLALAAGVLVHGGFAPRYTSIVFAPFVLICALGLEALPRRRFQPVVLVLAVLLGYANSALVLTDDTKTQAGFVAADINATAVPGDVVVYCPDELGPSVSRLAKPGLTQFVYPTGAGPAFVDWVDFARRNTAASVPAFADLVAGRSAGHTLYLVANDGFRTYEGQCNALINEVSSRRGAGHIVEQPARGYNEQAIVLRFPAPMVPAGG
ncbi:MAG: glycosyltransferase family 39 protein [Actinomycetota bacterium]|nr:glycosyltransferase family 39 protein [Actinomycetota bacterium]